MRSRLRQWYHCATQYQNMLSRWIMACSCYKMFLSHLSSGVFCMATNTHTFTLTQTHNSKFTFYSLQLLTVWFQFWHPTHCPRNFTKCNMFVYFCVCLWVRVCVSALSLHYTALLFQELMLVSWIIRSSFFFPHSESWRDCFMLLSLLSQWYEI